MSEKSKKNDARIYYERRFELEFDNIESMEQIEALLWEVTIAPITFSDVQINRYDEQANSLYFTMQFVITPLNRLTQTKAILLLQGEAVLQDHHLYITGRVGFDRFPITIMEIVFVFVMTISFFGMWSVISGLSGFMCGSATLVIALAFVFRPLIFRHDIVRRIERVFTEATRPDA